MFSVLIRTKSSSSYDVTINMQVPNIQLKREIRSQSFNNYQNTCIFEIQSNLDYSKCQGPPDFLRIIGSSNFRNWYFSEMFGSILSVLIFDCISIKNGEQSIIISYL